MFRRKTDHIWVLALLAVIVCANLARGEISGKPCGHKHKGRCLKVSSLATIQCPIGHMIGYSGCHMDEVCCTPYVEKQPKYVEGDDKCGVTSINPNVKIVGGKLTSVLQYPWTVSLQKRGYHACGGSIIADRWILTAAHCTIQRSETITIVAGSSSKNLNVKTYKKRYYVTRVLRHESYIKGSTFLGHDIALIKLSKSLDTTTKLTRKVCLPDEGESFVDHVCVASGWGYLKEPVMGQSNWNKTTVVLQSAPVPIMESTLCDYYIGKLSPGTICAGYKAGGVDTCQGDSGGPLVCQDKNGIWKQAGIVSTGAGCARIHSMGIYTDVSYFLKWIKHMMESY